jgi:hypothetical protein
MTLLELRISSYLFYQFAKNDIEYKKVTDKTFDLTIDNDLGEMLDFLRNWGCRQFKKKDSEISSMAIKAWYINHHSELPASNKSLLEFSNDKIVSFEKLFDDLMNSHASNKNYSNQKVKHTVGPVGAAKTLFALRKNSFPPWDNPIIDKLELERNGKGYCQYLLLVKDELSSLKEDCEQNHVDFDNLQKFLKREYASLPKLIDEFFWVSITRGCVPREIISIFEDSNKMNVGQIISQ